MKDHTTLTMQDAARKAGVSVRTLYRWVSQHRLPTSRAGDHPTIDAAALERFLAGQRPKRERNGAGTRNVAAHILDAAIVVAAREGAAALTIERVAQEAGLTIGGVSYHYASRQALHEALVTKFIDDVEATWRRGEQRGLSVVDAYIATSTEGDQATEGSRAVVSLVLGSPPLRRRVNERVRRWYARLHASGGEEAVQRCLAADAIWLFGLLGISPLSRRQRVAETRGRHLPPGSPSNAS